MRTFPGREPGTRQAYFGDSPAHAASSPAPPLLLRLCFIAAALGAVLIWSNLTTLGSLLGLVLMGVSLAPIFPSLIATTPARLGAVHTANGVGLQIAAAVLGQSFLPALVGILARHLGLEIVGPALCTAAVVLLALYELLLALPLQRVHPLLCVRR